MPYINSQVREELVERVAETSGELNFAITTVCNAYLAQRGISYAGINDVIGALECAKQEFYRRVAVPYETDKLQQNGDVYPPEITDGVRGLIRTPGR